MKRISIGIICICVLGVISVAGGYCYGKVTSNSVNQITMTRVNSSNTKEAGTNTDVSKNTNTKGITNGNSKAPEGKINNNVGNSATPVNYAVINRVTNTPQHVVVNNSLSNNVVHKANPAKVSNTGNKGTETHVDNIQHGGVSKSKTPHKVTPVANPSTNTNHKKENNNNNNVSPVKPSTGNNNSSGTSTQKPKVEQSSTTKKQVGNKTITVKKTIVKGPQQTTKIVTENINGNGKHEQITSTYTTKTPNA